MDVTEGLKYSYLEQYFHQINRLTEEINAEGEARIRCLEKQAVNRLFKYNAFEDIDTKTRIHLERILIESLKKIGGQISDNFKCEKETKYKICVIDKRNMKNFTHDGFGVINLKQKETIKFSSLALKTQALMLQIVAKILYLIQNDKYMSLRELYYLSKELCESKQIRITSIVDDLCSLFSCSRVHLRILCQPKGLIYGDLTFKLKCGRVFECLSNKEGTSIPTPRSPIVEVKSSAKFILIVEKDSIFQKILGQDVKTNFLERYRVLLFTAKGYPDVNSRAFINLLWRHLKIPILALTDADPHGLEIVCCYKFGCYATASESPYLAVPHIRWLGLLPTDVKRHSLPPQSTLELQDYDKKKLESLMRRPHLKHKTAWLDQMRVLKDTLRRKAELEAFDGDYLVGTYLPNKLRYASWL